MRFRNFAKIAAVAATCAVVAPSQSFAETNLLIILDGSGSMWGQIEGKAKITTAQDVLASLLTDLPEDTKVGLMVYGHRQKESCEDIELVSALGADDRATLSGKIKALQPKGKTPIAGALNASLNAFSKLEGQNNHVVLISDGIETCEGDPCAAAQSLAQANIQARVHVVGFDVGAEERAQLECISRMGNGKYFIAANAEELKVAIAEVQQLAQAATEPKVAEFFRDDFDGDDLADHWEVLNPNPDTFIVEDGQLLVLSGVPGSLTEDTVENLFRLNIELPEKKWTATAKVTFELATQAEWLGFGLYEDKENYVLAGAHYAPGCCPNDHFNIHAVKAARGQVKSFTASIAGGGYAGFAKVKSDLPMPLYIRLTKEGRSFIGAVKAGDSEEAQWVELEKLTMLRAKGGLTFLATQVKQVTGETAVTVDWIKIEVEE